MSGYCHARRHRSAGWATFGLVMLLFSGCGNSALPPPLKVHYRNSLWGMGKVMQITNDSAHHLYNVRVVGREYNHLHSGSVQATDHLSPHQTIEVGWLEFGAWVPEPDESLEVYADNYLTPYVSIVPH